MMQKPNNKNLYSWQRYIAEAEYRVINDPTIANVNELNKRQEQFKKLVDKVGTLETEWNLVKKMNK